MKKALLLLLFLSQAVSAQFQVKQWYFGAQAGIDFTAGTATAFNYYSMYSANGSTAMSDCDGNLLFYSNGEGILNAQHQHLLNDSLDGSSSLPVIAVPHPGQQDHYYLFYMKLVGVDSINLKYAVIDMNYPGGKVVTKNTVLLSFVCEKLSAVQHENKQDFWLLTHKWNSDEYYAFLIDQNGLSTSSVISHAGPVAAGANNRKGSMEFAVNGRKLVSVFDNGFIGTYHFNRNNGQVIAEMDLSTLNIQHPYGASFSPSMKMLYIASLSNSDLYQVDLTSGNVNTIVASKVLMDHIVSGGFGEMQPALDGKLYIAIGIGTRPAEIVKPDEKFPGCGYNRYGIFLNGNSCNIGLPNFVQTWFDVPSFMTADQHCSGENTIVRLEPASEQLILTEWFVDPPSATILNSNNEEAEIVFEEEGTYMVHALVHYSCGTDTIVDSVIISATPIADLGNDTSLCPGNSYTINIDTSVGSVIWSDGSVLYTHLIEPGNTYSVLISNNGCEDTDELIVEENGSGIQLQKEGALCSDYHHYVTLTVSNAAQQLWMTNMDSASMLLVKESGLYTVTAMNDVGCSFTDSIYIEESCPVIINVPNSFTPNNDGVNDRFQCIFNRATTGSLTIFNRSGRVVFNSSDPGAAWDGSYDSSKCPEGVYGCLIEYTDEAQVVQRLQNWIVLLR